MASYSLMDVVPAGGELVPVRGGKVRVQGVGAPGVSYLFAKYPFLADMVVEMKIDAGSLMAMGGGIVASIIAAGCGFPGDPAAEEKASTLTLDEQADLLISILRQTMPQGLGPFVEKLGALGLALSGDDPASKAPATKSPKASKN